MSNRDTDSLVARLSIATQYRARVFLNSHAARGVVDAALFANPSFFFYSVTMLGEVCIGKGSSGGRKKGVV
jgi:hypothetical protein